MIFRRSRKQAPPAPPCTPNTVTIEDLLQLKKRAEQPPPEFWTDFERQFKERQRAAAIQEKHPSWWHVFPRIAVAIPAGATAALAIGFIVWRNAAPTPVPATGTLEQQTLSSEETASAALATLTSRAAKPAPEQSGPPASEPSHPAATVAATEQAPARVSAAEAAVTKSVTPQHLEAARDAFASIPPTRNHRTGNTASIVFYEARPQSTRTTSTAALFQMPIVIDSDLVAALPASTINTQPTTNTDAAASENTQEPTDPRRARLLTYADSTIPVAAATTDNPRVTRLRDRVTSRFDDKALSDSISRFATTGDSLTIKF